MGHSVFQISLSLAQNPGGFQRIWRHSGWILAIIGDACREIAAVGVCALTPARVAGGGSTRGPTLLKRDRQGRFQRNMNRIAQAL
jgi:hypothetical protein